VATIQGVHHLSLTVSDIDASTGWYSDLFGMNKVMDETHEGGRAVVLMQPEAMVFLGLHVHDANQGERFEETRTGMDHVSFAVTSRAELENWEKTLADKGVVYSPITDAPYGSVLVFRDPDNIQLELFVPAGT
jgi:glyoxylase I family protein